MKILGIDTTTKFLTLGIYDNSKLYEYTLETGTKLSVLLVPTIERVLNNLGLRPSQIDYFACGLGPGSFTGMRIGMAAIKGLSYALRKPVIGIPTLDIIALNAGIENGIIVPIIDAKRNFIYFSAYQVKGGVLKKTAPYQLLKEEELLKKIKDKSVVLGDALTLYKDKILMRVKAAQILDNDYWYPRAHNLISLALEKIKAKDFTDSFKVKPIYLYPKECQVKKG